MFSLIPHATTIWNITTLDINSLCRTIPRMNTNRQIYHIRHFARLLFHHIHKFISNSFIMYMEKHCQINYFRISQT